MAIDFNYLKDFVADLDEVMKRPFKQPHHAEKRRRTKEKLQLVRADANTVAVLDQRMKRQSKVPT
ncbi:hypothetical protein [Agrobacterium tumefaciens]|uniref:hypothetical protein n=1 Tax=Agrobacterium tumefaciens TaxID=358 RepID=UPI001146EAD5